MRRLNILADFTTILVFNGPGSGFPSGVFSQQNIAETWIKTRGLSGILTCYPVDTGVYDWELQSGFFRPKNEEQQTAAFIQKFSSASQEHFHYEDGTPA
jgi:hypothetical protein